MKQRVLSGTILFLFLAAIVIFNDTFPPALNIAISLISAISVYEILKAFDMHNNWSFMIPSMLTAIAVPFFSSKAILIIYVFYTAVLFLMLIIRHKDQTFTQLAMVFCMVILIPCGLNTIVSIRTLGGAHGMFYVLIAVLSAWTADAAAYFAGTLFGKHKLCPSISPKKTIEGAIGGSIGNIVIMILCGLVFSQLFYPGEKQVNYLFLSFVGLFASLTSILGDLSFSLVKRSFDIKDFGQVIPGHGGILDRFDSVIFTAPFVYIFVTYFPLILN